MTTEQVLVLPRSELGELDLRGLRLTGATEFTALRASVRRSGTYLPRNLAEEDPAWKQLIPYVVVRDGERVFLMHRTDAGGDARLHGRASIGVGGHINPVDGDDDQLMAGLRREWAEELDAAWEPDFRLVGLLNDDTNPVGAVHLGVVFEVEAAGRPVTVRERDKLAGSFVEPAVVREAWDRLETWSQLVAEALGISAPEPTAAG
jgi:predicted NUDIX family phosphoesterase